MAIIFYQILYVTSNTYKAYLLPAVPTSEKGDLKDLCHGFEN